jgi:alkanesulfonate monooxygenase SsuD/methylene tetrahydromethanopterin reductase-like flavin-dependent oxidoreductase (luciferase family)
MEFSIGTCAKIGQVGLIKQAEDLGVTHFGVGEGPLLFSDPYQQMALASQQTSTIKMGTYVTNPLTRIAPVTANSVATLNALAPGRTFLGVGTANNALRSMGNRPAKISELVDAVKVTRGLLRGERVVHKWLGEEHEIEFLDKTGTWYDIREVPIWMAAGGPKGLKAAAEIADAVIYCLGPNPDMIKLVRRRAEPVHRDDLHPIPPLLVVVGELPGERGFATTLDHVEQPGRDPSPVAQRPCWCPAPAPDRHGVQ